MGEEQDDEEHDSHEDKADKILLLKKFDGSLNYWDMYIWDFLSELNEQSFLLFRNVAHKGIRLTIISLGHVDLADQEHIVEGPQQAQHAKDDNQEGDTTKAQRSIAAILPCTHTPKSIHFFQQLFIHSKSGGYRVLATAYQILSFRLFI